MDRSESGSRDPHRSRSGEERESATWLDVLEQLMGPQEPPDEGPSSSELPRGRDLPRSPAHKAPERREIRPPPSLPDAARDREFEHRDLPDPERPIEPESPPSGLGSRLRTYVGYLVLLLILVGFVHQLKPMPDGTHVEGKLHTVDASSVELLYDLTYLANGGERVFEQRIFDRLYQLIDSADSFLVLDMFLFNRFAGDAAKAHRPLTAELTERLLARRRAMPDLPILFVTDPINTVYGGEPAPHLDRLREAGVSVVITDLRSLRDSNPLYSSFWRVFFQWFDNEQGEGDLANPFDPDDKTTLRSYLHLVNFKANHRKVLIAGRRDRPPSALVTSANPHDASSAHSNVALLVEGGAALDLARSELDVARFSGWRGDSELSSRIEEAAQSLAPPSPPSTEELPPGSLAGVAGALAVEVLSEGGVRDRLLADLAATAAGDRIDAAMFYLSHRDVIDELLAATRRGVRVRLILDPNRDAFGREKNGIPNRSVAHELVGRSEGEIELRWYQTHGEQFHTKMTAIVRDGELILNLGSSNLTRRNIDDYNLEVNLRVVAGADSDLARQVDDYFERLWTNREGAVYTVDYDAYADSSPQRYWTYRVMEATGLSTF